MTVRTIRVFISSPADVQPERVIAERVVQRLARQFSYHLRVEPVRWERQPLRASEHFQDGIVPPRETDIVVVILWSRLGVTLPADKYRGAITGKPVTGTEWEFEDALASYRARRFPDLLAYRKTAPVSADLEDASARAQQEAVSDFLRRWFLAADGSSFTAAYTSFADATEFEERLADHLTALLRQRLDVPPGDDAPLAWIEGNPFRGLLPFEFEHAVVFQGRTRARNELREQLARQDMRGTAFVLVTGASGSGKSSLVRAGLLPDLATPGMVGRVALCRRAVFRPSDAPRDLFTGLAAALLGETALPELSQTGGDEATLATALRDSPATAGLLLRQALTLAGQQARPKVTEHGEARLALVIDQLEELFTLSIAASDQAGFVRALHVLAGCGAVFVIATLRNDYFARIDALPELARLAGGEGLYALAPPSEAEFGEIITRPARDAGLRYEADPQRGRRLDEEIRAATAHDPGTLPLLSFLLDQLWRSRSETGLLTFAAWEALGGLAEAVGRKAAEIHDSLAGEVRAELPAALASLVAVGLDAREGATRQRVPLVRFAAPPARAALVQALVEGRLLVADRTAGGEVTVELVHEALLHHWQRVAAWIETNQARLRRRARVAAAAALWQAQGRHRSFLLARGTALTEAMALLPEPGFLSPQEADFVVQSQQAARRSRQFRVAATAAGVLLLAGGSGGWWYGWRQPSVQHFKSYTKRFGVFEGAGPITAEAAGHRWTSYRATRRGRFGPVMQVEAVDGLGRCTNVNEIMEYVGAVGNPPAACRWTFQYNASSGLVTRETAFNAIGEEVSRFTYSDTTPEGAVATYSRGRAAMPMTVNSAGAAVVLLDWEQGRDRRWHLRDAANTADRPSRDGNYRGEAEYDSQGRMTRIVFLDRDGKPFRIPDGYAAIRTTYDAAGNAAGLAYYDENDRAVCNKDGYAAMRIANDTDGNMVEVGFLDAEGRPVRSAATGAATVRIGYDVHGERRSVTELDERGIVLRAMVLDETPRDAAARQLAETAIVHSRASLEAMHHGDRDGALGEERAAIALLQAELAKTPTSTFWAGMLATEQVGLGELLRTWHDPAAALAAYRAGLGILDPLAAADPHHPDREQQRATAHAGIAQLLLAQDNAAAALTEYRTAVGILQAAATDDPGNTELRHLLARQQAGLGEMLAGQGDPAGALAAFRGGLTTIELLTTAHPDRRDWQRDRVSHLNNVAGVLLAQNDTAGALAQFEAGLAGLDALVAAEPTDVALQADRATQRNRVERLANLRASQTRLEIMQEKARRLGEWIAQRRLGEARQADGNHDGALEAFRAGLAIAVDAAARQPDDGDWPSAIATSQALIGDTLDAAHDPAGALAAYRAEVAVSEALAAAHPAELGWQGQLASGLGNVGWELGSQGDFAAALAAFRRAGAILGAIVAQDPAQPVWQHKLALSHANASEMLHRLGDRDGAIAEARIGVAGIEAVAAAEPGNERWQKELAQQRHHLDDLTHKSN